MSMNLENLALSILTASNPAPYKRDRIEPAALVAGLNGKIAGLEYIIADLSKENDRLKSALVDITRTPEGDEQSAQAIAREVLGVRGI